MKNIKFLLGLFSIITVMVSCATTQDAMEDDMMDDRRTQQMGNRLYVQDPFYGTVVLERDPYTGRYYDVTYGSRLGTGFYGYPNSGFRGRYNQGFYGRGGGGFRGNVIQQSPSRDDIQKNKEATRKGVLGN